MTWFALYTEPQREQFARDRLVENGFKVFYPHIPEWVGCSSHKAKLVHRPYFPRYLFVDCVDDVWVTELAGVWLIPGVIGAVKGTEKRPHRIARARLQPLMDMSDPMGAIWVKEAPEPLYVLHRGNRVKVAEGSALWGMVAEIQSVDGPRIVATIAGLFGRVMLAPDQVGEVLTAPANAESKPNGRAVSASA